MAITISTPAQNAAAAAIAAIFEVGGAPSIVTYDGVVPADVKTALSGNNVLVTHVMAADAFNDAGVANGVVAANAINDAVATGTGTATFFRVEDNAGTDHIQGTAGLVGASPDMVLDDEAIVSGRAVAVNTFNLTMPDGT